MQQVLDDPFLPLLFGITVPTVLCIVWGVMEIAPNPWPTEPEKGRTWPQPRRQAASGASSRSAESDPPES